MYTSIRCSEAKCCVLILKEHHTHISDLRGKCIQARFWFREEGPEAGKGLQDAETQRNFGSAGRQRSLFCTPWSLKSHFPLVLFVSWMVVLITLRANWIPMMSYFFCKVVWGLLKIVIIFIVGMAEKSYGVNYCNQVFWYLFGIVISNSKDSNHIKYA